MLKLTTSNLSTKHRNEHTSKFTKDTRDRISPIILRIYYVMCPGWLLTRMLFRYFIGTSVAVVGAAVQAGGRLTIFQGFDFFHSFIIQSSLHLFLMFLNFLIHCGIRTKQEMELLSCDQTLCHLCQFFIDLC